jgi:hypothetical protein
MSKRMWLAGTDPIVLLDLLGRQERVALFKKGRRRLRLFACACCRAVGELLAGEAAWEAIAVNERFADGRASQGELDRARKLAGREEAAFRAEQFRQLSLELQHATAQAHLALTAALQSQALNTARLTALHSRIAAAIHKAGTFVPPPPIAQAESRKCCELLRDIFGDPFRPLRHVTFPDVVRGVAEAAYQSQGPDHYLVLADALEEDGELERTLGRSWLDRQTGQYLPVLHLRRPGQVHVKGCHVVDWIRGQP